MPQQEGRSAIQHSADLDYGRYEGNQAGASDHYAPSYAQDIREGLSGKVYPPPHDKRNILCFTLAVIALGLIVLFGLLFGVVIGGMVAAMDFALACLAILIIAGVGIVAIKTS